MKTCSKERGCTPKINLGENYVKRADKLSEKHNKRYGVYRCPHCKGTHLTKKLGKTLLYAAVIHITPELKPFKYTL
jgi:hypothetical protein